MFLTENFKLPDLAGNFNFLEYGYLFDIHTDDVFCLDVIGKRFTSKQIN